MGVFQALSLLDKSVFLFLFQLLKIFVTCFESVRGATVRRVFPVGESLGVDYEIILPQDSSVTDADVNDCFAEKTGLDGFLGSTNLLLKASPGKTFTELSKHDRSLFHSTFSMNVNT